MKKREKLKYSQKHLDIINGVIPIEEVHGGSLNAIKRTALCNQDKNILKMIECELKRRYEANPKTKDCPIGPKPYTKVQLEILSGETHLSEVDGRILRHLYNKALENRDEDVASKVKEQIDILKERARLERAAHSAKRSKLFHANEEIEWKPPKTTDYTELEQKIIRNEIPLDKVHTNSLVSICKKAESLGNMELANAMHALVLDRRAISLDKDRARRNPLWRKNLGEGYYDKDMTITQRQQQLIRGDLDWDDFEEKELLEMLEELKQTGHTFEVSLVEEIIKHKRDPTYMLKIKTHEESLQYFERVFDMKITRPKDIFTPRPKKK